MGTSVLRSWTTVVDLSAKRELNNGFGNALSTAVELAVTPALMALIGWQIDRWLGTSPLFLLFLFAFTVGYVSWREYTRYTAKMHRQERELLGGPDDRR
jgi:F0F1-type ATP synthase assembly protein I